MVHPVGLEPTTFWSEGKINIFKLLIISRLSLH